MTDISSLDLLSELRRKANISQKEAGNLIRVDRKAISNWESGKAIPEKRHRLRFLRYLLETLDLQADIPTLNQIWQDVADQLWEWELLSDSERWILDLTQRSSKLLADIPAIPPNLLVSPLGGHADFISTFKPLPPWQLRSADWHSWCWKKRNCNHTCKRPGHNRSLQ